MSSWRSFWSDDFSHEAMGVVTGTSVAQFPNVPGFVFKLQGRSTNKGSFLLGFGSGSLYYEVDAGFETDWFPLSSKNLNQFYFNNVSGSSEVMTYWAKQ